MQYITYHVLAGKRRRGEGRGQESATPCWSPVPGRAFPSSTPHTEQVGAKDAPVYMKAFMENLAVDFLVPAGSAARDDKMTRHLQPTICNDEEMSNLLSGDTIAQGGGDLPNIKKSKA